MVARLALERFEKRGLGGASSRRTGLKQRLRCGGLTLDEVSGQSGGSRG